MIYETDILNNNLFNFNEGLKKGNIFKDIYSPYKKYIYNFNPSNERQKLLLEIMNYSFYAHDLNLYLDIYPNDINAINIYNDCVNKYTMLKNDYEKKYEPISLGTINEIPFEWVDSPWPWEGV